MIFTVKITERQAGGWKIWKRQIIQTFLKAFLPVFSKGSLSMVEMEALFFNVVKVHSY